MLRSPKRYTVKVYDRAGTTFRGVYKQLSNYSFDATINGGVGPLRLTLPRKFDTYNDDGKVNLMDEVQLWVQDKDTSGLKLYSGYIVNIKTGVVNGKDMVEVLCYGYVSRLGRSLDWDGTGLQVARNSQDPSDMMEDVIDKYQTNNSETRITYTASSIDATSTTATYQSDTKSCLESMEKIRQLAPSGWWWYVDAENILTFKATPTTATHSLIMGKDISAVMKDESAEDIINTMIFWNGLQEDDTDFISERYYSANSVTSYWESFRKQTDARITSSTTADNFGEAFVEANKDPNLQITVTVKDNNFGKGYDIESILPGHTIKILDTNDEDLSGNIFLVTKIQYSPESVTLICEDRRSLTGRRLVDISRNLDEAIYSDGIDTVTSTNTD